MKREIMAIMEIYKNMDHGIMDHGNIQEQSWKYKTSVRIDGEVG